jgi:phosphatidylglycerol:prolipoprotein diacylglycerol transferase
MIPYLEQPSLDLGPLTVHAFGIIVAAAVLIGLELGRRRFTRLGLDRALGERLAWWVVVGGFLGAHLFSVLFYFPHELAANPFLLLKFWQDISSFGGILGGVVGLWLFLRLKAPGLDPRTRWAYLEAVAFVFPFALAVGRIACSLAHDHPGTITSFSLAISLRSPDAQAFIAGVYRAAGRGSELPPPAALPHLGFHDLGWYEFLYLSAIVPPLFLILDRKPRPAGFFVVAFVLLYVPVRFALDFLRVSDARYAGLTPAQWVGAFALVSLPFVIRQLNIFRQSTVRDSSIPQQPAPEHHPWSSR